MERRRGKGKEQKRPPPPPVEKGGRDALKVEEEGGKGRGEIALGGGTNVDGSYSSSSPG